MTQGTRTLSYWCSPVILIPAVVIECGWSGGLRWAMFTGPPLDRLVLENENKVCWKMKCPFSSGHCSSAHFPSAGGGRSPPEK